VFSPTRGNAAWVMIYLPGEGKQSLHRDGAAGEPVAPRAEAGVGGALALFTVALAT
jgi:hypothetical protein